MEPTLLAPTPGSAAPGNLYADLQTRTLWLGVDPAVDANRAVLISDIVALQNTIASGDAAARSYTDGMVALRAPLSHTHPASQISDFDAAVTSVASSIPSLQYVKGMILMYSGSLADIGVGSLAGWALCDGGGVPARPDLRDKFILGAGNKVPGSVNPSSSFMTGLAGSHAHTISGTALTWGQVGPHYHNVTVSGSGTFLSRGRTNAHNHQPADPSYNFVCWKTGGGANLGTTWGPSGQPLQSFATTVGETQEHQHYVDINMSSYGNTDYQGSGESHTHGESFAPDHQHTVTALQLRDNIPYYTLAFIIKL